MPADIEHIERRFVRNLRDFGRRGYRLGKYQLREGTQREAFDGYRAGLEAGQRHGYYEIPTGVGKTAEFIALTKNYLDAVDATGGGKEDDAPRALMVVPTERLVVQTAKAIARFLPEIAPNNRNRG